jgi:putative hemolysin
VLWLLVEGQWKMLVDFAVVMGIASFPGTWQNKQLPIVPLSHSNHKRDYQKECYTHLLCGQDCHSSCKKVGWM